MNFNFLKIKNVWKYIPTLILILLFLVPQHTADAGLWSWYINKGLEDVVSVTGDVSRNIFVSLANMLVAVFGLLLQLSGFLMNYAIVITVQKMSVFINNNDGIKVAWEVVRDILNIGFIFTIVYIGISTILRIGGNLKKLLTDVIIAALLVNFSFFFTGVLIDASNILTLGVYNQIKTVHQNAEGIPFVEQGVDIRDPAVLPSGEVSNEGLSDGIDIIDVGISGVFMHHLRMQTIFNVDDSGARRLAIENAIEPENAVVISIFAIIIIFILTFAFLTIAILLFLRLVSLIFLLITSPIGMAGWAIEGLRGPSSKWWKALWGQLLFAPVYMVMTLIVILIISNPAYKATLGGVFNITPEEFSLSSFADAIIANSANSAIIWINYIIIVSLLYISVTFAKQTSQDSGGVISVWTKRLTGLVDSTSSGLKGVAGRNTLGRASGFVGDRAEDIRKAAEESEAFQDGAGRLALRAISGITRGVESVADKGYGAKFGSKTSRKDVDARETDRNKAGLKERSGNPEAQARFMLNLDEKAQQKAHSEMSHRNRAALEAALISIWREQNPGIAQVDIDSRIDNLRSRLSPEDIEKTDKERRESTKRADQRDRADRLRVVLGIDPQPEEGVPRESWTTQIDNDEAIRIINQMGDEELQNLGGDVFTRTESDDGPVLPRTDILDRMSISDFSALQRSKKLSRNQKQAVGEYIWARANGGANDFQAYLRGPAGNHWPNPQGVNISRPNNNQEQNSGPNTIRTSRNFFGPNSSSST